QPGIQPEAAKMIVKSAGVTDVVAGVAAVNVGLGIAGGDRQGLVQWGERGVPLRPQEVQAGQVEIQAGGCGPGRPRQRPPQAGAAVRPTAAAGRSPLSRSARARFRTASMWLGLIRSASSKSTSAPGRSPDSRRATPRLVRA